MERSAHTPEISVVVPSHDTRQLTLSCLQSFAAAVPDGELIVVDDGSGDGTAEAIAARFPSVRCLRNEMATGFTAAANRGLGAARGELLLLINSDTEAGDGGVEAVTGRFAADPRLGIAGARLLYPDGSAQWSGGCEPGLLWLFLLASGMPRFFAQLPGYRTLRPVRGSSGDRVDWVTGAAMALRREVWESVGPFDESYRFYAQDLDLCLRARDAGWRVEIADDWRVVHHHGATIAGTSGTAARQHPELLWTDLMHWAREHRGERWAARAARWLRLGARLRLAGRRLLGLAQRPDARARWQRDSLAYRRALEALSVGRPSH